MHPIWLVHQAVWGLSLVGPLPRLPQLCVGPALPPRLWGGSQVMGLGGGMCVGVSMGVRCRAVGVEGLGCWRAVWGSTSLGTLVLWVRVASGRGVRTTRTPPRGLGGMCAFGGGGVSAGCGRICGARMGAGLLLLVAGLWALVRILADGLIKILAKSEAPRRRCDFSPFRACLLACLFAACLLAKLDRVRLPNLTPKRVIKPRLVPPAR